MVNLPTTGKLWLAVHEAFTYVLYYSSDNRSPRLDNDSPDFSQTEEGRALITAHLDSHYRETQDQPLPMLDNKTPRECSVDPALHMEVVTWLKQLENRSEHEPTPDYDFSWMWRELELEQYKP